MTRAPPPPPPGVQFSARAELPAPDARVTGPEDARLSPLAPCRGPAAASRPPSGCPAFCLPVCLAHGHAGRCRLGLPWATLRGRACCRFCVDRRFPFLWENYLWGTAWPCSSTATPFHNPTNTVRFFLSCSFKFKKTTDIPNIYFKGRFLVSQQKTPILLTWDCLQWPSTNRHSSSSSSPLRLPLPESPLRASPGRRGVHLHNGPTGKHGSCFTEAATEISVKIK